MLGVVDKSLFNSSLRLLGDSLSPNNKKMFYQKFLKNKNKLRIIRSGLSWLLIILGLSILVFVWGPLVQQEIIFQYNKATGSLYYTYNRENSDLGQNNSLEDRPSIVPKSTSFGIIIPKIGVNAPVFANINPFNEAEFLPILKKGIAHAKNTSFPGQGGNVYLFAHSANSALEIQRYNAVFYLVNKLEKGDQIVVYYKEKPHFYYVFEKK